MKYFLVLLLSFSLVPQVWAGKDGGNGSNYSSDDESLDEQQRPEGKDGGNGDFSPYGGAIFYPENGDRPVMLDLLLHNPELNETNTDQPLEFNEVDRFFGLKIFSAQDTEAGKRLRSKLEALVSEYSILPSLLISSLDRLTLNFVFDEIPTTYEAEGIDISVLPGGNIKGFAIYTRVLGAFVNLEHWNATGNLSREALLLKESFRRVQKYHGLLDDPNLIYRAVGELLLNKPDDLNLNDLVSGGALAFDENIQKHQWANRGLLGQMTESYCDILSRASQPSDFCWDGTQILNLSRIEVATRILELYQLIQRDSNRFSQVKALESQYAIAVRKLAIEMTYIKGLYLENPEVADRFERLNHRVALSEEEEEIRLLANRFALSLLYAAFSNRNRLERNEGLLNNFKVIRKYMDEQIELAR